MTRIVVFIDPYTEQGHSLDVDPFVGGDAAALLQIVNSVLSVTRGGPYVATGNEKFFVQGSNQEGCVYWITAMPSGLRDGDVVIISNSTPSVC